MLNEDEFQEDSKQLSSYINKHILPNHLKKERKKFLHTSAQLTLILNTLLYKSDIPT